MGTPCDMGFPFFFSQKQAICPEHSSVIVRIPVSSRAV